MKNFTLLWVIALAVTLSSCYADRDDVPEILSEWKLVAVLDANGEFVEISPNEPIETISFLPHSRVSKNPYWCGEEGEMTVNYSEEGFIYIYCLEDQSNALMFEIEEEFMVITDPSCPDGCKSRYERTR